MAWLASQTDPAIFHEPFVVKRDAEGRLVERTVRQMIAAEVLAAIAHLEAEADCLDGAEGQDTARSEVKRKLARLLFLILCRMPEWRARTAPPVAGSVAGAPLTTGQGRDRSLDRTVGIRPRFSSETASRGS